MCGYSCVISDSALVDLKKNADHNWEFQASFLFWTKEFNDQQKNLHVKVSKLQTKNLGNSEKKFFLMPITNLTI